MHHDEHPRGFAELQEDEAVFRLGVVWIVDQTSVIVIKHRLGFDKRYAVLAKIRPRFRWIPSERELGDATD